MLQVMHGSRLVVGLASDRPGAGKSTAAHYLTVQHGFLSIAIGDVVKAELDEMIKVHGFRYEESNKEQFRPGLSWWTEFRITHSSPDYWLDRAVQVAAVESRLLIPDVRYPNEADYVRNAGGIVIKIERPSVPKSELSSEVALNGYDFDYVVFNDLADGGSAMFKSLDEILQRIIISDTPLRISDGSV